MSTLRRLQNVQWATYQNLVEANQEGAFRLTYDHGCLEIEMSPLPRHESPKRLLEIIIDTILFERGINYHPLGSVTFTSASHEQGAEPDSCFYIQSFKSLPMDGDTIDPKTQIPDLVIEVDVTSLSLDKLGIYATLKVPEIWRWQGGVLAVLVYEEENQSYQPRAISTAIPGLTAEQITQWLQLRKTLLPVPWRQQIVSWSRTSMKV